MMANATIERDIGYHPFRQYDERERTVSTEAWQLVYDAANIAHRGILEYPAVDIMEFEGEKCLVIYIPNIQEGVEGYLPESRAGLRPGERLESLMRYPYIRVTPIDINRQEGYCVLSRELAQKIAEQQTWNTVSEGNDIDAMVVGVQRVRDKESIYYGKPVRILLDVGGVEAVMPISEYSHNYVDDVNVAKGDVIKVRIIQKRETPTIVDGKEIIRRRYVVSKRALEFNPWNNERFIPKVGVPYNGEITYISERYVHVTLSSGIDVLAHRPSLNYKGRDKFVEGRRVVVYITHIDRERRIARGNFSRVEARKEIRYFARRQRQLQKQQ